MEVRTTMGCALSTTLDPAVEYRVWPMARVPESAASAFSLKTSDTCPIARRRLSLRPSQETMPELSCPRCCRA
jgi:hypothetical protein